MSTVRFARYKFRILQTHKDDLERLLQEIDLVKLSVKLLESRVISKYVNDKFASLDQDYLDPDVRVRYLLQHVYEKVKSDDKIYDRVVRVLSRLGGGVKELCLTLSGELDRVEGKASGEAETLDEACLTRKDVPIILDLIVSWSYMWEGIGIALGLPEQVREGCRSGSGDNAKLSNILTAWISGGHDGARPATVSNLRVALASEIVGLPEVERSLIAFTRSSQYLPAAKKVYSDPSLEIHYQSSDTEVANGRSTLLEVQVTSSESVSYQWSKDGQPLCDGLDFSDVCSKMLYINRANQRSEGQYSCCVSNVNMIQYCQKIMLTVKYSLEKKCLLDWYSRRYREIHPESWPFVSKYTLINVTLITKSNLSEDNIVRGDLDDILRKKKIKYKKALNTYKEGALVLIEGRPGSGKTTLVHKLARDWAEGKILDGAEMVFQIFLQVLRKDETLSDVLEMYYNDVDQCMTVVSSIEKSRGKGVCFILDGLDEYQPIDKTRTVIYRLLSKRFLHSSMVIVASRPVGFITDLRQHSDKRIEIIGFSKEQIFEYLNNYRFSNLSNASQLKTYLKTHVNILYMCYIPLHAAMICSLFENLEGTMPITETQIYEQFTLSILLRKKRRYLKLKSLKGLGGKDKTCFNKVCALAFDMTINSKRILSQIDAKGVLSDDTGSDAVSLGLLTVEHTFRYSGMVNNYIFLHSTFQEYLAAVHIAQLESDKQLEVIKLYGKRRGFLMVWRFYCGTVMFEGRITELEQIMTSTKMDTLSKIQCAFESQQSIVCDRVLDFGRTDSLSFKDRILTPADFFSINYVISSTRYSVAELVFDECEFDECELEQDGMNIFLETVSNITFYNTSCHIPLEQFSSCSKLVLINCCIDDSDVELLVNATKTYKELNTLHIDFNRVTGKGAALLANSFETCTKIEVFSAHCNQIDDSGALALANALVHLNNPRKLDLQCNAISEEGAVIIAMAVERLCNGLELYLNNASIIGKGVSRYFRDANLLVMKSLRSSSDIISKGKLEAQTNALKCCKYLPELHIGYDPYSSDDKLSLNLKNAAALTDGLVFCTYLQTLNLNSNSIGSDGAVALAMGLKNCTSLHTLNLSSNDIHSDGAMALADGLEFCTDLRTLNLYSCSIGSDGAVALAHGLKFCSNLKILNLSHNDIDSDGAAVLADGLIHCVYLQTLDLSNNKIGSDGEATLIDKLKFCANLYIMNQSSSKIFTVGQTSVTYMGEPAIFRWKGYGLELHFEAGGLPPHNSDCTFDVSAAVTGDFEFPDNTECVSGIFRIECPLKELNIPVTVKIQHYVAEESINDLIFTVSSGENAPYRFQCMKGGHFTSYSGEIRVVNFSYFAIVLKCSTRELLSIFKKTYLASVYLSRLPVKKPDECHSWNMHFSVVKNCQIFKRCLEKYYFQNYEDIKPLADLYIEFQQYSDKITLDVVDSDGTVEIQKGWRLSNTAPIAIFKSHIDGYVGGCPPQIVTKLAVEPQPNMLSLNFKLKINGVIEPYNFIVLHKALPNG